MITDGWRAVRFGRLSSRPISAFRIGIALILLKEALLHLPLAESFYSDWGVFPSAALNSQGNLYWMGALSAPWMVETVFAVWAIIAVLLLFGVCTRFSAILNFILIVSISARNVLILSGADTLLRLLSFWMIFIPLDRDFTWRDIRWVLFKQSRGTLTIHAVPALPVWLLQGQVALAYLMAGLFKLLGQPWRSGNAVFEVLQLENLLRPLGHWLINNLSYGFLQLVAYTVILAELAFPVLVFIPVRQPRLRRLGLSIVFLMHLGIALALSTPLFDFVLVFGVSYIPFFAQPVRPFVTANAPQKGPLLTFTLLIIMMFAMVWQNADDLRQAGMPSIPPLIPPMTALLDTLGLQQHWQLFAPTPVPFDWSVRTIGTFDNGTHLDLRTVKPPESDIPPARSDLTDYRWSAFELNVIQARQEIILDAWSRYLCRKFNSVAAQPRLLTVQLRALTRHWHTPGASTQPLRDDLLWLQSCSD